MEDEGDNAGGAPSSNMGATHVGHSVPRFPELHLLVPMLSCVSFDRWLQLAAKRCPRLEGTATQPDFQHCMLRLTACPSGFDMISSGWVQTTRFEQVNNSANAAITALKFTRGNSMIEQKTKLKTNGPEGQLLTN